MEQSSSQSAKFINQANERCDKKEHVKISDTAKFRSCRPNMRNDRHLKISKIREKCMVLFTARISVIHLSPISTFFVSVALHLK